MNYIKIILTDTAIEGLKGEIAEGLNTFKRYNRGKNLVKVELANFELDPGEVLEIGFIQCDESGNVPEDVETVELKYSLMSTTDAPKVYVAKVPDELFMTDASYYLIEIRRVFYVDVDNGDEAYEVDTYEVDTVDSASVGPVPVSARALTREGTDVNVGDVVELMDKAEAVTNEALDKAEAVTNEALDKMEAVTNEALDKMEAVTNEALSSKVSKAGDTMSGMLSVKQKSQGEYRAAMAPLYGGFELSYSAPLVESHTYYSLEGIEYKSSLGAPPLKYTFPGLSGALVVKEGLSINLTTDENFVMTLQLINEGKVLSEQKVDLPLESVVVDGKYDEPTNSIILTLQNGTEVSIPVPKAVNMDEYAKIETTELLEQRITTVGADVVVQKGLMSIMQARPSLRRTRVEPSLNDKSIPNYTIKQAEIMDLNNGIPENVKATDLLLYDKKKLYYVTSVVEYSDGSDPTIICEFLVDIANLESQVEYNSNLVSDLVTRPWFWYKEKVNYGDLEIEKGDTRENELFISKMGWPLETWNLPFLILGTNNKGDVFLLQCWAIAKNKTLGRFSYTVEDKTLLYDGKQEELTDEEKTSACERLGALQKVSGVSTYDQMWLKTYTGEWKLLNASATLNNAEGVVVRTPYGGVRVREPLDPMDAVNQEYVDGKFVAQDTTTSNRRRAYAVAEDGTPVMVKIINVGAPESGGIPVYNGAKRIQTANPADALDCVNKGFFETEIAKISSSGSGGTQLYGHFPCPNSIPIYIVTRRSQPYTTWGDLYYDWCSGNILSIVVDSGSAQQLFNTVSEEVLQDSAGAWYGSYSIGMMYHSNVKVSLDYYAIEDYTPRKL